MLNTNLRYSIQNLQMGPVPRSYLLLYYESGCFSLSQDLLYVVPFVAKVLESCAESRVFKPPNPWTMGIMAVLSELHAVPDLKVCGVCVCVCGGGGGGGVYIVN